jgi:copper chaperone CopZ
LALEGVEKAEVNLDKKELAVSFVSGKEDLDGLKAAVKEAGYDAQ